MWNWDGNELLLSDILGTDEDIIYRDLEDETERKLLNAAIDRLNPPGTENREAALWSGERAGR